jgi:nitrilase
VVDPWGAILGQHAVGAGLVVCELDLARLQSVRQQLPALQHRRL